MGGIGGIEERHWIGLWDDRLGIDGGYLRTFGGIGGSGTCMRAGIAP